MVAHERQAILCLHSRQRQAWNVIHWRPSDLIKRVYEHKEGLAEGFTKRYDVKKLVYYEIFGDITEAIHREKCIKKWNRDWKIRRIEEDNPDWEDLYLKLTG